jgi:hypothetical protein
MRNPEDEDGITPLITHPLRDFYRRMRKSIDERVREVKARVQEYDGWLWDTGDRIRSDQTGRIYTVVGRSWDMKNNRPMYYYESDEGDKGSFIAERAHGSFVRMGIRRNPEFILFDREGALCRVKRNRRKKRYPMMYALENPNYEELVPTWLIELMQRLRPRVNISNLSIRGKIATLRELFHNNQDKITWYMRLYRVGLARTAFVWMNKQAFQADWQEASNKLLAYLSKQARRQTSHGEPFCLNQPEGFGFLPNDCNSAPYVSLTRDGFQGAFVSVEDITVLTDEASGVTAPFNVDAALAHFMSLDIPSINDLVFGWTLPGELRDRMRAIEEDYMGRGGRIPFSRARDFKVVMDFGDGYYWFDTELRNVDDQSFKSTGHCSTCSRREETAFVLREHIREFDRDFWRPVLQFCLDKRTGLLGEMKGHGNSFPRKKYFKYIVPLLLSDYVTGIVGGGYKPKTNFRVTALPRDLQDQLSTEKPDLFQVNDYIRLYGIDDYVLGRIDFTDEAHTEFRREDGNLYYLQGDWGSMIHAFGTDAAKEAWEALHDGVGPQVDVPTPSYQELQRAVDDLPDDLREYYSDWADDGSKGAAVEEAWDEAIRVALGNAWMDSLEIATGLDGDIDLELAVTTGHSYTTREEQSARLAVYAHVKCHGNTCVVYFAVRDLVETLVVRGFKFPEDKPLMIWDHNLKIGPDKLDEVWAAEPDMDTFAEHLDTHRADY